MRAVIYARFSSDNQRTESIDAQVRACEEYAKRNDMFVIGTYTDEAFTATSDKRPSFQKMIKEAESKLFDVVIVHKLDRFSRDKYDSVIYKRKLKNLGVRLHSVTENIDGSPESIILESVIEGMAQYYSANLAREVMKGLTENALKAKHTGGKPPFGYDIDSEKNYVINSAEALAVKEIFKKCATGEGYKAIIEWLNKNGFRTKYGKPFTKTSLFGIFNNEKYKGTYIFNKYKRMKQDGKHVNVMHDDEEIIRIEGGIPAIVSDELWQAVQSKAKQNVENMRSSRAKESYLLVGKLYCGKCKAKMIGNRAASHGGTSLYSGYACSGKKNGNKCTKRGIKKTTIENAVVNFLDKHIFNSEFINQLADQVVEQYKLTVSSCKDNAVILDEKLKHINLKIKNNMQAIEDGLYSPAIKSRMQELELQKLEVQKLIYEEKNKNTPHLTKDMIVTYISRGQGLGGKSFEEQKELINLFVDKIYLYDDEFKIYFYFNLSEQKATGKSIVLDLPVVHGGEAPA